MVMLMARDGGYKCRPFVILSRVFAKRSEINVVRERLLIWDQCSIRKSKAAMKKLDELRIDSALVLYAYSISR